MSTPPTPRVTEPGVPVPDTAPDDPRIGHLLGSELGTGDRPRAVILGFPSDEGVRRNGGRVGAAEGPAAIRRALYRLTPDAEAHDRFVALIGRTRDLGDLVLSGDLERDHALLASALEPWLAEGVFSIVLGGGHETSFGHFLAYASSGRAVRILNWDAHTDVRKLRAGGAHSGSPFRQALEHPSGCCRGYTVAGLQPHSVSRAQLAYLEAHGGRHLWRRDVTPGVVRELYAERDDVPLLASFDLDAVDRAAAPGVSAPATSGLATEIWLRAAYLAGRTPWVGSADVVELCPPHDRDGQTAALAAVTVWQLLKGLAERD